MDHRTRSHPTLTPLTTFPSPTASSSYLYPTTSIPSTPSLLSRPSSTTRLRPIRSQPTPIPSSKSSSALAKAGKRKSGHRPRYYHAETKDDDDDWITRTASTLTLTRLEEKGQSWLAARHSSTSLTGGGGVEDEESEATFRTQHERDRGSHSRLRLGNPRSRGSSFGGIGDGANDHNGDVGGGVAEEGEDVGPDFVDVDEIEEEDEDGEEVDEGEMRKVVMGRVGGWVDWAVGWLDLKGDADDDGEDNVDNPEGNYKEFTAKGELDPVELQKRLQRKKRDVEVEMGEGGNLPAPPMGKRAGAWSDAKWLFRVATMAALE